MSSSLLAKPNGFSNLSSHNNTASSSIICSKSDEKKYLRDLADKNRLTRIKQVRE